MISKSNEYKYLQFGLNVAHYRKIVGYTQEELAEESSLSRTYISNIESPNKVQSLSLEAIFRIADALCVEAYKLLEFRD